MNARLSDTVADSVEAADERHLSRMGKLCDMADEVAELAETMLPNGDQLYIAMGDMSDQELRQVCWLIALWLTGDRDAQISAQYDTRAIFMLRLGMYAESKIKNLPY